MFCPSCGAEYTIELKYCNRCGANLGAGIEATPPPVVVNVTKPALIISALLLTITLGGFGVVVGGAMNLAPFLHGNDPLMAIIMFGMLTILIVDIFLARLLFKTVNAALAPQPQIHVAPRNIQAGGSTPYLRPPTTSGLQPLPSVTESTTRFLEPQNLRPGPGEPTSRKN